MPSVIISGVGHEVCLQSRLRCHNTHTHTHTHTCTQALMGARAKPGQCAHTTPLLRHSMTVQTIFLAYAKPFLFLQKFSWEKLCLP